MTLGSLKSNRPELSSPINPSKDISAFTTEDDGQNGRLKARANAIARKESPIAKSWAHFVAGGIGGMTAAGLTAPLDVLKTRLQSDFYHRHVHSTQSSLSVAPSAFRSPVYHIKETFAILAAIPKVEGWRALFKGLGPNLTGVVPARAINFYAYGNGKRLISSYFNNGHEAAWVHLSAAVCAGIITGTATNPIWLVKTRLQLDKDQATGKGGGIGARRYRNSLDCVKQVVQEEGVRGLYKGLSASYLGVSESTLQWVLYEQMKLALARREDQIIASGRQKSQFDHAVDWSGKLFAAGGAKLFAAVVTYPHEVVRTRLRQAPLQDGRSKYTGLVQCFRLTLKEEGMIGLYGGLTPHILRVVPSAAIMFGMYEVILRAFGVDS